jgi:hypothetical protein
VLPGGPAVGTVRQSPRGDWRVPSAAWLAALEKG